MKDPIARLWLVESTPLVERQAIMPHLQEHLDYQDSLEARGVLFGAGPVMEPGGKPTGRGLIFVTADSLEAAEEIAKADPMHARKLRSYKIFEWSLNEGVVRSFFQ